MNSGIVTFEDLRTATGYRRQTDVARCLERQGVRFFYGRDGLWTTIDALNAALGLHRDREDNYDPDAVL